MTRRPDPVPAYASALLWTAAASAPAVLALASLVVPLPDARAAPGA